MSITTKKNSGKVTTNFSV